MFFLVLFLVQFNNCIAESYVLHCCGIAFRPRPELQGLPLTSGETCQAKVGGLSVFEYTNACTIQFEDDECGKDTSLWSQIKDCPNCDCLNGRNINYSMMIPKINPQLVERIQKSNTFEVAGLVVSDTLFHMAISVVGITFFGLLVDNFPLGLLLVPLGIAWLLAIGISFIFTSQMIPEVERSPEENAALVGQAFLAAVRNSTSVVHVILSYLPMAIWGLPHFIREKEIEAIRDNVYVFELEDLLNEY